MRDFQVIGIAGKARTGKDTVAEFIISANGGYRYSFADPLRAMLVPLGIDMNDPYWRARKELPIPAIGVSPRRLMQTLGTEWGREMVHPDIWVSLARQRLLDRGPGMIIPDVRFDNEAKWVRKVGGLIIHLERPGVEEVEQHSSEDGVSVEMSDLTIKNDGTLDQLLVTVRGLFRGSI